MDYHLKSIEQFVSTYLKPNESFINRMNQACVEDIILKMIIEIEKVKIFISQSYYSFDEERKCEQFIRNHQRRIVIIINQVNKGIRENSLGSNAKYRVQNELMEHLNELLKYLENEYTQCLDDELFITTDLGNKRAHEFAETTARFHDAFFYSDTIVRIALEPIDTFIKNEKTNYTYSQVKYLVRLSRELEQLHRQVDMGFKVELVNVLTYLNFNNNSFFTFLTNQMKTDVEKKESTEAKLLKLSQHLKHYKQRPINTDIALLPKRPSIKNLVITWITEEIRFLELYRKLMTGDGNLAKSESQIGKFQLNISREQLSVLIKIALESGILMVDDIKALVRVICRYFSTKKQKDLSDKSLYNSIFKLQIEDGAALQEGIKKWINAFK